MCGEKGGEEVRCVRFTHGGGSGPEGGEASAVVGGRMRGSVKMIPLEDDEDDEDEDEEDEEEAKADEDPLQLDVLHDAFFLLCGAPSPLSCSMEAVSSGRYWAMSASQSCNCSSLVLACRRRLTGPFGVGLYLKSGNFL